jgi:thiol-disulfide isomerase/thioredoxin
MNLSRKFLLLVAVLSIAGLAVFPTAAQRRRAATKKAPVISVAAINADGLVAVLKRDSPNARPLLVNFWATWCDPCREEFPDLVKIDQQYRPLGLDFTAISLDDVEDIKTSVPKFLLEMKVKTPTYLLDVDDPEIAMSKVDPQWSGALPATFLYDGHGKIVYKRMGRINVAELTAAIDKLLRSSESPVSSSGSAVPIVGSPLN